VARRRPPLWLIAAAAALAWSSTAEAAAFPGTTTRRDRAAWRSLLHWPASCERSWTAGGTPGAGIASWRAAAGARLVAVDCFLGAYQGVSILYLAGPGRQAAGPLRLRLYVDEGNGRPTARSETSVLGALSFDPGSRRLTVFDKARGLGDCGIYSVLRLRAGAFVPVESRAKTACDGRPPFDPRRWPRLPSP
jgi:hypothetical protein